MHAEDPDARANLTKASSQVVAEFIAGRWLELDAKSWGEIRNFLLTELLERCPGFSTRQYRLALNTCLAARNHILKTRCLAHHDPRMFARAHSSSKRK